MKFLNLSIGDICRSITHPELPTASIIGRDRWFMAVLCDGKYEYIDAGHFLWNREVELVSSNNDFSKEQKKYHVPKHARIKDEQ